MEEKLETMTVPAEKVMISPEGKKRKTGMIVGIVALALLAVAGLSFGVYGMASKDAAVADAAKNCSTNCATDRPTGDSTGDKTNTETDADKKTDAETSEKTETVVVKKNRKNPIISATEDNILYEVYFEPSTVYDGPRTTNIRIGVIDGKVEMCYMSSYLNNYEDYKTAQCKISGLNGKVYKMAEAGAGQDNLYNIVSFIMEDGSVYYFALMDILTGSDFEVKKLNAGGYIVDMVDVLFGYRDASAGGYGTTALIYQDGTYAMFDRSML